MLDHIERLPETSSQGFLPVPGDACLWIEVAPCMAVHRLSDIALKETNVHLGEQVVERSFGSMEIHYRNQSEVQEAGDIILRQIETTVASRMACRIAWNEIIRGMTSDHTTLINRQLRKGSMTATPSTRPMRLRRPHTSPWWT